MWGCGNEKKSKKETNAVLVMREVLRAVQLVGAVRADSGMERRGGKPDATIRRHTENLHCSTMPFVLQCPLYERDSEEDGNRRAESHAIAKAL